MALVLPGAADQEVDLPGLRRALADVGRQVDAAQASVIATIEARHAEFVTAADEIEHLRRNLRDLKGDLRQVSDTLRGDVTKDDGGHAGPVAKLGAAVAEHQTLAAELDALDAAAQVLTTILAVRQQFEELDNLISRTRYCDAAELTLEIARALQCISSPDTSAEPAMVRAAKTWYYQRRAILVARLEDALSQFVAFGDRCTITRQSVRAGDGHRTPSSEAEAPATLQQVWDGLQVLGLRSRRLELLAGQATKALLRPLLDAARRLPCGRQLRPQLCRPTEDGTLTWTWVDSQAEGEGAENVAPSNALDASGEKQRPPARAVIPVLESLLAFAQDNWAGGLADVYAQLGTRLWPLISRSLMQQFDACGGDAGEAVEQFEMAMFAKGFIASKEKTLSRHVHEHRHALGVQRRSSTLNQARQWMLEDATLVSVCDASEPGSVSQLLRDAGDSLKSGASSCALSAPMADGAVSGKLRRALEDDDGLLRLPEMRVSQGTHKLVGCVRSLMEEAISASENGREEVSRDLGKLVRELCTLFAVLRPYAQKEQLRTSPRSCAVFLADCLYLTHALLLMPYTYGKRLSGGLRHIAFFVDLVPQLRRLGENHFLAMLRHQQDQLVSGLSPCDFSAGIARDRTFVAAEAALGAAAQQAKSAAQGLVAALPEQLLREVIALFVGIVCRDLLGKLFDLRRVAPEEAGCVSALLTSALAMGRSVVAAAGLQDLVNMDEEVPGWAALVVVADLLGSDFSRFLERRADILRVLTKDEAERLMQLSWIDESIEPGEAWEILRGADT